MVLDQFLSNNNLRNEWIRERNIDVYVRRSFRLLDDSKSLTPCLDIASVEVHEDYRGIGIFKSFLNRFEREAEKLNRAVYVESILNKRLVIFLLGKGYKIVPGSCETSPNMFKRI